MLNVSRMQVRNVRVLGDVEIRLQPVTVLIGNNNSGKSTVLDALTNFSNVTGGSYRGEQVGKYSFGALLTQGAKDDFIEYEIETDDQRPLVYQLCYREAADSIEIVNEVLRVGPATYFDRADPAQSQLTVATGSDASRTIFAEIRDAQRHGGREDSTVIDQFARSLSRVMTYRLVPYIIARPSQVPDPDWTYAPRIMPNGRGLATLLAFLESAVAQDYVSAYEDLQRRLRASVDGFDSFVLSRSGTDEVKFSVQFKDSRGLIPAEQISDGTLSLIGHLALLCSPSRVELLCLEEPESGLTTRSIAALMRAVRDASNGELGRPARFVIATHSPYLAQWAWNELGADTVLATDSHDGGAEVLPFAEAFPELDPARTVGAQAFVSAMGWQFG